MRSRALGACLWLAGLSLMLNAVGLGGEEPAQGRYPLFGIALDGYPIGEERLVAVAADMGLQPKIVSFYLMWPSPAEIPHAAFPHATLEAIGKSGALPCLTWEPMYIEGKAETTVDFKNALAGVYDGYIRAMARAAKSWGKPFVIRLAHEMNLERYHWGVSKEEYGPDSPMLYQKFFRHVVAIFREEGATNALWAFCPNAESLPEADSEAGKWNKASAYYPGSEWVDLLGMDGYNWGVSKTKANDGWDSRWISFEGIFSRLHVELRQLEAKKPVIIFETASVPGNGQQGAWFADAIECCRKWNVAGMVWFQVKKEEDWRLRPEENAQGIALLKAANAYAAESLKEITHDKSGAAGKNPGCDQE